MKGAQSLFRARIFLERPRFFSKFVGGVAKKIQGSSLEFPIALWIISFWCCR